MLKIVKGDLIQLAKEGQFQVIAHGCNCMCVMGAGIAPIMAREFGADKYSLESERYKGDINKLGQIQSSIFRFPDGRPLVVTNAYTQYSPGVPDPITGIPLNYNALALCLQKLSEFKDFKIGLPWIGCGLAGGNKEIVKEMVEKYMADCDVTIVEL